MNNLTYGQIDRAIQEFEDEANHHSLHPEISAAAKMAAIAALQNERERMTNVMLCPECAKEVR